jgi:hypothetical protein
MRTFTMDELDTTGPGGLLERYRESASDSQGEAEAEEWSEGLIGDVFSGPFELKRSRSSLNPSA